MGQGDILRRRGREERKGQAERKKGFRRRRGVMMRFVGFGMGLGLPESLHALRIFIRLYSSSCPRFYLCQRSGDNSPNSSFFFCLPTFRSLGFFALSERCPASFEGRPEKRNARVVCFGLVNNNQDGQSPARSDVPGSLYLEWCALSIIK